MERFSDDRTAVVFNTGFAKGIPKQVGRAASWKMHVLIAAVELQDVTILGPITRWAATGRLGVQVSGKWHITFNWMGAAGPMDIRLERC